MHEKMRSLIHTPVQVQNRQHILETKSPLLPLYIIYSGSSGDFVSKNFDWTVYVGPTFCTVIAWSQSHNSRISDLIPSNGHLQLTVHVLS